MSIAAHRLEADRREIRPRHDVLDRIQRRILWLAVRMVDYANHDRPHTGEVKIGGHQASSASMVTIMTALWFAHLRREDRVSVKPHASPVYHAIQYLLGELDEDHLRKLRAFGGLQAYPSNTKDPDPVDFSTGSVGLGAAAPLFAAAVRRYIDAHFGERPRSRFIALLGDAELDEGNIWEAIVDPVTAGLGNVLFVVDLNRQSLDRVVPGVKVERLARMFEDNGWHVGQAKYGTRLRQLFAEPGGQAVKAWIDAMSNEQYQSLFPLEGSAFRDRFLQGADPAVGSAVDDISNDELAVTIRNLGGHDLGEVLRSFREADEVVDRPSIIFAYTIKGWGLPIAGHPLNHAALLTKEQLEKLRQNTGLSKEEEWARFAPDTEEGSLCERVGAALRTHGDPIDLDVEVPESIELRTTKPISTQEAFGRIITRLGREPEIGPRLVTTTPDVAVSTNLGGWINQAGVFAPEARKDYQSERTMLRWKEHPGGQHIELGISEMNLFLLLGQLGLSRELHDETLFPVGSVYDPFICRGLDALIYACYSRSRFILVGTPSGVTLSPEGGAHQSTITPSIGLEMPGLTCAEPAYVQALNWIFCDGIASIATDRADDSLYLRLTTRPLDQEPFESVRALKGDDAIRRDVLAGGYRLCTNTGSHPVIICASGAVMPEVVEAARQMEDEGIAPNVVDVTSLDRLYRSWQRELRASIRSAENRTGGSHLERLLTVDGKPAPIVTVHDAASHSMAWLGSVFGVPTVSLGVDEFGQSGEVEDLYEAHDLLPEQIFNAALLVLDRSRTS